MKCWILLLLLNCSLAYANGAGELAPGHYAELEKAVAKKEAGLKETYLKIQAAVESFKVKQDPKELAKTLRFYHDIFKFDKNHFIVEMFSSVYRDAHLRPKLMEALTEGLSADDRRIFLERLSMAVKEEDQGNG